MKNLSIIILIALMPLIATAQKTVTGTVKEKDSNTALVAASVFVTDASKNIVASTEANVNGRYTLELPESFVKGTFTVSYLGYTSYTKEIDLVNATQTLDVALAHEQNELQEVVIETKRRAVTIKGDKIIFNVESTGIGNGNNGLETIRLIPGMRLDKDENLLYRGSGNIQILINGKKSMLTGDALREYIRSLKGSDIESIEIIAQPSARYEASGTAGIINIVLKKNRATSLNGNIYSWASYGEYFKSQQGARLYYNDSLWALTANASYYNGQSVNHRHIKQNIALPEGSRIIDQYNEWLPVTKSGSLNIAAERKLNKNQMISTEWQYYNAEDKESTYGVTNEYLNNSPQNVVNLTRRMTIPENRITGNLFYNFTADSASTKLDLQANFARYKTREDGYQQNNYAATSMNLEGLNNTSYTIANVQADFTHKLSKNINLETGVKYAYVKMNYYNRYTTNSPELSLIPDSLLINDFTYDEKLASAYAQASGEFGKWNIQAGLRSEYYKYVATSPISHTANKGAYTNLFPSLSVAYQKENNQYQFSYSRRIGRPEYLSLNPYYQYLDAYTIQTGNPALKPQFYHSFQLSYIYKSALSFSLYGYLYNNGFTQVIDYQPQQNYNITYSANAAKGNRFGFSASLPYEPTKWWTMQLGIDAYYTSERSDIERFAYNGNGLGYDINLYENIQLNGNWKFTMTAFYTGRATTPNGYSKATYDFSLSAKKSFFDQKLQFSGGCSNILKNSFYNHTTKVNNVSTDWTNRWETRRFYLQLTYSFGSGKNREIKSSSVQEETQRI